MISRVPLIHSLILAALVFLTYRSTLTFNFVWDDFLYVEQNTAIQSWAYLDDAFTSPQTTWSSDPIHTISEWRPVRNISFLIDHTLYGLNPTGWHLTNLILHAIATILLYHLIKRLINLATPSTNPRREATPQLVISNSELVINPSPSSALTATGLLILLLALLPYANIIPMMQILAERFLYLPLIGPALLLSTLILTLHRKTTTNTPSSTLNSQLSTLNSTPAPPSNPRRAATPQLVISNLELVIILLLILALTIQTTRRLPVWQNDIALFTSTLKSNPHSWRPPNNLAKALLKYGHTTPALHIITPALHQFPRDPDIVRTAALIHLLNGHETTGTQLTQYATQLQPNDPRATKTLELYYNLKAKGQLP